MASRNWDLEGINRVSEVRLYILLLEVSPASLQLSSRWC